MIALFSHTGFAGYTIRASGTFFPGEEFAVCGRQEIRRTHGGEGKRVDTYGFYSLNSRFPLFLSLAQIADM